MTEDEFKAKERFFIRTPEPEDYRKPEGKWVTRVFRYAFGKLVTMLTFANEDEAQAYIDSVINR